MGAAKWSIRRSPSTEDGSRELVKAEIPRDHIVLAFKPPSIRPHTGFAVS